MLRLWAAFAEEAEECSNIEEVEDAIWVEVSLWVFSSEEAKESCNIKEVEHFVAVEVSWVVTAARLTW